MTVAIIRNYKSKIHPSMVYNLFCQHYCSNTCENVTLKTAEGVIPNVQGIPEAPTTCCMTGCPNCVWLDYADKLTEYFKDGGEKATKEINEHVTDPNVKAYLMHELRMRNK